MSGKYDDDFDSVTKWGVGHSEQSIEPVVEKKKIQEPRLYAVTCLDEMRTQCPFTVPDGCATIVREPELAGTLRYLLMLLISVD